MNIRTIIDPIPSQDEYGISFRFEDFTDEEKFLMSKYGMIAVDIPNVSAVWFDNGRIQGGTTSGKISLDRLVDYKFLFRTMQSLNAFKLHILEQIQKKLKDYLTAVSDSAGEELYEVSATGEIKKINEGARKALNKNSKEYKEIIEKNREAFEKLSKL